MGALVSLGVVVLVLATLSLALAGSPVQGVTVVEPTGSPNVLDVGQASEDTAQRVSGFYTGVIDDLMTFSNSPDLERAQERTTTLTSFAVRLSGTFRSLADYYEAKLSELTEVFDR